MTLDPRTATLDEIRDWFAKRDGWLRDPNGTWSREGKFWPEAYHPYPPTLDGAAKALPEGWWWTREGASASHRKDGLLLKWSACQCGADKWGIVETPDTGNEIADRYRLAVKVRLAGRSNPCG